MYQITYLIDTMFPIPIKMGAFNIVKKFIWLRVNAWYGVNNLNEVHIESKVITCKISFTFNSFW
jgi:hypothetical protein